MGGDGKLCEPFQPQHVFFGGSPLPRKTLGGVGGVQTVPTSPCGSFLPALEDTKKPSSKSASSHSSAVGKNKIVQ